ncbi:sigma-70 family RNA polymerase sigma factor [Thalassococcus sp. BH17M4-6]|uniref:sigma-70 family RNA polymerase sigma factor n=1 Tax=Thalassococcus sp. BH17M4-6 TaxID=3413148 RepID=UPI003BBAF7CF
MFRSPDPLFAYARDAVTVVNAHAIGDQRDNDRAGPNLVNGSEPDSRPQWVDHLIRIRDSKDEDAFVALFGHFAPRVKGFLMRSGTDAALAEECAQEVMVTVWHKAHLFDPSRASVATWIFTIARNKKIDVLRKQRRPEPEDLPWGPEAEPDQADVLALQEETEQLGAAIAALPAKQRELIEKAYFGDLSHSEIADVTGLPLGTIKSRIRLALDRLRHAMQEK